ncbi:Nitrogen regulation protein C [uncultured Clostridium sp.]|uniref:response regulator transcription factor n=1 Tax=uncultured Clostridium sp. TaxID=59620 RepID=UPI0008216926|nr:response regulator transcription factor [uncultured Clostridium sp.]SCJ59358.1 Nitrogen regulation protein C [uncultured Clostridium sp.]
MESKIKILLAEDFEIIRDDFCELIESQDDMEIVGTAATRAEIVKLAKDISSDIILMDIEMDALNSGILATEEIHKFEPDIPVIFLTAHDTDEMIVTAMASGAVDYVVKSAEYDTILKHIRKAYEGEPILEARIQTKMRDELFRLSRTEKSLLFFINNISKLTPAERELIKLFLKNKKIDEIAKIRCVEVVTVKTQIKSLLKKFGLSRTKEIVKQIRELNIEHLFENA